MAASKTCGDFASFPKLPLELQRMVWKEVARDLAHLDYQRFIFEIVQDSRADKGDDSITLCFRPHEDFINLTFGHRALLQACRESRWAAHEQIECYLPIQYLDMGTTATNALRIREAKVPFNPNGQFCISGLGPAIENASHATGARNLPLPTRYGVEGVTQSIRGLELATSGMVKNLTIALDWPDDPVRAHNFLLGWDLEAFDTIALGFTNLQAVAVIGEGVMNRRHHIEERAFKFMHKPLRVEHGKGSKQEVSINWRKLYNTWEYEHGMFQDVIRFKIKHLGEFSSTSPEGLRLTDNEAKTACLESLKLTLDATID